MRSVTRNISDVRASERWDFGYHDPAYLELLESLDQHWPTIKFGNTITLLTDMGAFSLYKTEFFVDDGIPFLRVQNVQEHGVDLEKDTKYISREYHEQLQKSQLAPGDLLLTTKAVIGVAAVVQDDLGDCNMSQNLVRIHVRDGINPHYLAVFLNSRCGRIQTETAATGPNQKYLNFERIRDLTITLPPRDVQDRIAQVMQDAYATRRAKLTEAEALLAGIDGYVLEQLNIDFSQLQNQRTALKPISAIIGGRFDFEAVVTAQEIKFNDAQPVMLRQVVRQVNDRVTPASEYPNRDVNYISLANIASNAGELVNFSPVKGSSVLSSSPKFKQDDILYGRMRPYLNKAWIAEFDGVCSGEALVFRPNKEKVDVRFLHTLLLSRTTLAQIVPLQSGTSLPRVSASDVLSIKLPIPKNLQRQTKIVEEIMRRRGRAKRLRAEAESVVTEAKAQVERMILGEE